MGTNQPQSSDAAKEHRALVLDLMPQQREVRAPNEDWTGVTSAAERRKLQNRLNNRAWRKRQAEKAAAEGKPLRTRKQPRERQASGARSAETAAEAAATKLVELAADPAARRTSPAAPTSARSGDAARASLPSSHNNRIQPEAQGAGKPRQQNASPGAEDLPAMTQLDLRVRQAIITTRTKNNCRKFQLMSAEEVASLKARFEAELQAAAAAGSPLTEQLVRITQFNVMMALRSNYEVLGIRSQECGMDTVSPFCRTGYTYSPEIFGPMHQNMACAFAQPVGRDPSVLPPPLKPTELQRVVPHHPWIDVFPIPRMRDNILRQGEEWDDTELCLDLVECWESPHVRTGFIVWGDPWDPNSWEVSEEFLRKWGWVVQGCFELFCSTNNWRSLRGERLLPFPGYRDKKGPESSSRVTEVAS